MNKSNFRQVEAVIANAPVGVLVTHNRRIARYNRKFLQMFGFVGQAGVGQAASVLYPSPEAYDALGALAVPLLSVGKPLQTELTMRRQDGTVFWAEVAGYVLNTQNAAEGTVWFIEDRSDWQAAQAALQQALLENEAILDNAQAGIAVLENRRIARCNRRMDEIFGYSAGGGLSGQATHVLYFSVQEFEESGTHIYRILGESGVYSGEHSMRCLDGSSLWCHVSARALDPAYPLGKSIWIFEDITERKATESALSEAKSRAEAAAEVKSMFLANMSHEIRTPMNAIIGLSYLAQKTVLTVRQRDYMQKIHGAGTALLGIVNDILDFSKIEAGQIDLECIDFSLDDILDNIAVIVGQRAQDKGLELIFDLPPDVPRFLRGDPLRLSQVLTNLVSNAVKFTETGTITVAIEQGDSVAPKVKLHFAVRDTGIGLSEAQMLRLFRPFTQADGSTTRKYGGTGLGLSICKRLVELMGGEIGVTSAPGNGSAFSFSVSFEFGDSTAQKCRVLPAHLDGMRVLVADDNAAARDVLLRMLESFGLRVDAVACGEEAVAAVAAAADLKDPYRVAFIDWRMPGMDGIDTVLSIRADPTLSVPPAFVLVSAFSREDVRIRAEQSGIDLFLVKPVGPSALEDTLVTLFPPDESEIAGDIALGLKPTPPELNRLRILLAEDNEINQQIVVELLESAGTFIDVVSNGREAVDKLVQEGGVYDLVLMDLQMPVMGGHEATRLIRADPRFAKLPIIAMTAHAMADEGQRCFDSGMNDHLTKPVDPDELFRTLACYGTGRCVDSAATAPQADPLFAVSGLDTAAGLRRTGGKMDFYRKLLRQFLHSQRGVVQDIHIALVAADFQLAARLAHTLKGVAGNIGAMPLSQLAAEVDDAIREKPGRKAVKARLIHLDCALDEFCIALAAALGTVEAATPGVGSQILTGEIIQTLVAAFQRSDGGVVDYFDAHADVLRKTLPASDFNALASAVRNYDFGAALARLGTLPDSCRKPAAGVNCE